MPMNNLVFFLLAHLDTHGIEYCVLGSARDKLNDTERDVDLVVRAKDVDAVGRLARTFCEKHAGRLIRAIGTEGRGAYFVLAWLEAPGPVTLIRLDVHTGLGFRGRMLRSADEILGTRVVRRGAGDPSNTFYAASPGMEFVRTLLKGVDRRELTPRAEAHLSEVWKEGPEAVHAEAARAWSPELADLVAKAARTGDFTEVRARLPELACRAGVLSLFRRFRESLARGARLAGRLIRPTGFTVAFLGIDGSGKSSVVRSLVAGLEPAFPRTRYHHFKPNILGMAPRKAPELVMHPTGVAPGISLLGAARLAYYLIDYSIGYAVKVWPQRLRSALVIFDRYFYDLPVDPIRLRARIPMTLARWCSRFVPKPDLVIVVDTPPELARSRKAAVPPIEEAARQRAAYLELARALPNACILDGSKQVPELAREAGWLVLERMSVRTTKRLGWGRR